MNIHPMASVAPEAKLGRSVLIGPGAVIDGQVEIGDGTTVGPHAVITGHTTVGRDCYIYTGAVIGSPPQDLKYRGERSYLRIGDRNRIREYVTINPATENDQATIIGSDNLIMAYCHIAHNCQVGSHTVLANNATLAGHVTVEDHAILGGLTAVHQFCRIGAYAMVGGYSKVIKDIPPYCLADGYPARIYRLNRVGLKRHDFSPETLATLERAYRLLVRSGLNLSQAIQHIRDELPPLPEIVRLLEFINGSRRGLALSRRSRYR
ncbi:MAG TPA: acyl-ACP--UDP-N-acetylglucosamine O-acyltransferase [bacterium]|uniref:Acyl-[acyl-carrier-protein]--UDP-N-acetylglucosamine O-acyltransferase n=1 Tax=candidate division TA06 bacterium ADurb.Bin417 TaxID=1852828 RepID=A0A1V5MJ12_UNCT6|nr:MAG: Acyl-(acyl-carrier-protein)--UDP-N-acetylglucosamine O-acyltransferase [candidate division TA06 bacterium ADurb.Bin417]HNQ34929.1 acyl-ACP--UDP-N-acetylglucosamine O-acyltransferase [bacterium]HNS49153.1 acyl-ACP--UDP-N-acetylglucosamine O-acyltransferase [bacterium]